ncbi:hypothetical protein NPIL_460491, partial [Nephila pilipes]
TDRRHWLCEGEPCREQKSMNFVMRTGVVPFVDVSVQNFNVHSLSFPQVEIPYG